MDAAGDAVVVWGRSDGSVWASGSVPGAPWTAPVRLTDSGEVGLDPTVALDPSGDGFAVWQTGSPSSPGRETRIRARRVSQGRWEPAQEIQLSFGETGGRPQIAIGNDGTGTAVWYELHGGVYRIWANRYRPAAGWGTAEPISPDQAHEGAIFPDVGADALGNAMAAWVRFPGGPLREIEARRFDAGWGTAEPISPDQAHEGAIFPDVGADALGNAMAAWIESPESGGYELWAAWFAVGAGWGAAQRLQSAVLPIHGVAMDARGNGIAVWPRREGDRRIVWASRFQPSRGWGPVEAIGTELLGPNALGQVSIALSPMGDGIAAWQQWDGTRLSIWANRLTAGGAAPPPR
jgi:hypothetical protein